MDEEARWKEALHAGWTTPDDVIDELVRRVSGAGIATRTRIIGGEGNEVWSIETPAGDELMVRISHLATFAAEHWAVVHSRSAGAPVPEVLLVDDAVVVDGKTLAVWIHRTIPGRPLGRLTDAGDTRRLTADAGELLTRIHSVPTAGYGWLDGQGRGPHADFSAALAWNEQAAEAALATGISRDDLEAAAHYLESSRQIWTAPHLLHGDWLPEHVLVDHGNVTGIIDFGGARSGDPAYDFAYWQFFWDFEPLAEPVLLFPEADVIRGYRRAADPGPLLERRVQLCRLGISMRTLMLYWQLGRGFAAHHCARRFAEALAALREKPSV